MKEMIREIIREEMIRTMSKKYYFMSGLPRAGSTLLSSILNQNPKIYSGPSSPVVSTMLVLENSLANDELFLAYPKPEQAAKIISSVISTFYSDIDKPIIIDKNRSWVNRLHYIPGYFGIEPKVLCPVRDIDEILTSFITMNRRNPFKGEGKISFIDEMLIKTNTPLNDNNRCRFLVSQDGILGQSYNGIKKVLMESREKNIHFIEYNDLINNPKETMRNIYNFLEEDFFEHDFNNIINTHKELDAQVYGLDDMHEVRKTLQKISANPKDILSEEILNQCNNTAFWRDVLQEENNYSSESDNLYESTEEKLIGA